MTEPRRLLTRLLEYIEEQAKEIDPRQFCLSNAKGFIRRSDEIAGLPGVEYDIKVEGDHVWLRVARFTPSNPPAVPDQFRAFIRASHDPDGSAPILDDAAFRKWLNKAADGKAPDRRSELEKQGRATVGKVLTEYVRCGTHGPLRSGRVERPSHCTATCFHCATSLPLKRPLIRRS